MFRISKLLENDYAEIYEPVIVESPFTQVTTNGIGIRQYHIALTASKLLFACDDVNGIELNRFAYHAEPAETQTLTLVHLMPLSAVQIHFYNYNGRQIMRINRELDDEQSMFLEIGAEEFQNISEPILVECPFTQVSETGLGIRQYQVALTANKILFACDDFENVDLKSYGYRYEPPETETLSLVSFMPLEALKIHFYRYNGRQIMRITILGEEERPMFFEIGGHMYQSLFWNTFREQISCLHLWSASLQHITGESPYASTDVLENKFECQAVVHVNPESWRSSQAYATSHGYFTN